MNTNDIENLQKYGSVPNLRQIKIKLIRETNYRGKRICIYEPKRYYDDKTRRVYLPYKSKYNTISEQAFEYLTRIGFNVVSRASEFENYIFFCDNWGEEFIDLK
jgi:hypothetical protein